MMFTTSVRRIPFVSLRSYSTAPGPKASIKLVGELRKRTDVSLSKARDALTATDNNVDAALKWLEEDLAVSGAQKAAKVQDRSTQEGLVCVSILSPGVASGPGPHGVRAAMVELNCETDFVGRGQLFAQLVGDIAHTAAFISEPRGTEKFMQSCSLDTLLGAPLLSPQNTNLSSRSTVGSAIRDLIAKVGENVSLRRAVAMVADPMPPSQMNLGLRAAGYLHGSIDTPSQGRIGSLALLALKSPQLRKLIASEAFRGDLEKLERSIARQIVGFETLSVRSQDGNAAETALYNQPFMMMAGAPSDEAVRVVLERWAKQRNMSVESDDGSGVEVLEFAKWTVGETLD